VWAKCYFSTFLCSVQDHEIGLWSLMDFRSLTKMDYSGISVIPSFHLPNLLSLDSRVVGQVHRPYFSFINFLGFKMWWWFRYFSSIILILCPMRLWQKQCDCKWDISTCTILCCFWHHTGFSLDTQQLPTFQSLVYHSTVKDLKKESHSLFTHHVYKIQLQKYALKILISTIWKLKLILCKNEWGHMLGYPL